MLLKLILCLNLTIRRQLWLYKDPNQKIVLWLYKDPNLYVLRGCLLVIVHLQLGYWSFAWYSNVQHFFDLSNQTDKWNTVCILNVCETVNQVFYSSWKVLHFLFMFVGPFVSICIFLPYPILNYWRCIWYVKH